MRSYFKRQLNNEVLWGKKKVSEHKSEEIQGETQRDLSSRSPFTRVHSSDLGNLPCS